jgi:hypothetical protein
VLHSRSKINVLGNVPFSEIYKTATYGSQVSRVIVTEIAYICTGFEGWFNWFYSLS